MSSRIYMPPEWSFRRRLLCLIAGHRWTDHHGMRVSANWYVGSHTLWCDRCGSIR